MSGRFRAVDRDTAYLLPPSVQDWLPEDHLARFVVEVASNLDLHELEMRYAGRGSKAYHPEMLLGLLFYGYATGVFASRKLEAATYDSLAFRYIAANTHPDHDTIATFRKRFLKQLKPLFVQILLLARTMGVLNLGKISLDGSKVQGERVEAQRLELGACDRTGTATEGGSGAVDGDGGGGRRGSARGDGHPGGTEAAGRPPEGDCRGEGEAGSAGRPNAMPPSRPNTRPRWPNARPGPRRRGNGREGSHRKLPSRACAPTTRSI